MSFEEEYYFDMLAMQKLAVEKLAYLYRMALLQCYNQLLREEVLESSKEVAAALGLSNEFQNEIDKIKYAELNEQLKGLILSVRCNSDDKDFDWEIWEKEVDYRMGKQNGF